ncbi:MAG: glycosyltransferase [Proteobacteria bacterium]|nr:glycosyltransferase [Pseudomonadota bacterium]
MPLALPGLQDRIGAVIYDRTVRAGPPSTVEPDSSPLISCLMVTRNRPRQAALAVECFARQTHQNRELVIVDGGEPGKSRDDLAATVAAYRARGLRLNLVHEPQGDRVLGEMRNIAVSAASGAYVATWDDDDLSDPLRLELQYQALRHAGAVASFLGKAIVWAPRRRLLGVARFGRWENTMVCAKAALPGYPAMSVGEDVAVGDRLAGAARIVVLEQPRLYLHVQHGSNASNEHAFRTMWTHVERDLSGADYDDVLLELADRMPVAAYRGLVQEPPTPQPVEAPETRDKVRVVTDPGLRERILERLRSGPVR